jgi:flavin-dependent dehydrogenase
MERFDAVVVGAGIAGLQAGWQSARRGLKVLLVDQHAETDARVQSTGIFVRRTLETYAFPPPCLGGTVDRICLYSPRGRRLQLTSARPEFRMGRMPMVHRHLLGKAQGSGCDVRAGWKYLYSEPLGQGSVVRLQTPRGMQSIRCAMLVGADGCRSSVARDLNLSRTNNWIVGIEDLFELREPSREPSFHCFLEPTLAPGFLGWVVNNGESVHIGVGGYPQQFDPAEALELFKQQMRARFSWVDGRVARRAGRIPVDGILARIACARGLLVGDAAGAVSPLTAGGLDGALRLSEVAAAMLATLSPAELCVAYTGSAFRGRRVSGLAARKIFDLVRHPDTLESVFHLLRMWPLSQLAQHLFFGRDPFTLALPSGRRAGAAQLSGGSP